MLRTYELIIFHRHVVEADCWSFKIVSESYPAGMVSGAGRAIPAFTSIYTVLFQPAMYDLPPLACDAGDE